ncbi:interferon-induced very large GTPase 1-like protein [Anopheles sinensis]|uniref:Interferon-induced very large GTPase 1-like protein n=1 Tax=Anopheles sinensis TaxID=74873 RepID=A0A084VBM8_ANOSI|nr:interferon-induced very large GTPase 1-like protein [Anopheles sinensis]
MADDMHPFARSPTVRSSLSISSHHPWKPFGKATRKARKRTAQPRPGQPDECGASGRKMNPPDPSRSIRSVLRFAVNSI